MDLVDQHCHGLVGYDPGAFAGHLSEGAAHGFDSPLGLAVRAICPPLLDLPAHAPAADYLARRAELGEAEVTRRMLASTGIADYLVDTGIEGTRPLGDLVAASGARAYEVVRLESVAARVLGAPDFVAAFEEALARATAGAVGVKSIAAYRYGLGLDPARPSAAEVRRAAADSPARPADPVLLRHLLWAAVDRGLPIQVHTGFGDTDLDLHRADPSLLTPFLRATADLGTPVVLLHCYPYHRSAGYLAQVFPHVYADVGLALNHTGGAVLPQFLELAPFDRLLFSTDAYGPPELYATGAALFRTGLRRVLDGWVARETCSRADADRIAALVGVGNARRLYGL